MCQTGLLFNRVSRYTLALTVVGLCSVVLATGSCRAGDDDADEVEAEVTSKTIEEVLEQRTPEWMAIPGVVGTGIGRCEGEPCIRVFVVKKSERIVEKIPPRVNGYPVDIVESGRFEARGR